MSMIRGLAMCFGSMDLVMHRVRGMHECCPAVRVLTASTTEPKFSKYDRSLASSVAQDSPPMKTFVAWAIGAAMAPDGVLMVPLHYYPFCNPCRVNLTSISVQLRV